MNKRLIWQFVGKVSIAIVIGFCIAIGYMWYEGSSFTDLSKYIIGGSGFLFLYIISFFVILIADLVDTLVLTLEYTFGLGSDIDECLDKVEEWGERQGIIIKRD